MVPREGTGLGVGNDRISSPSMLYFELSHLQNGRMQAKFMIAFASPWGGGSAGAGVAEHEAVHYKAYAPCHSYSCCRVLN